MIVMKAVRGLASAIRAVVIRERGYEDSERIGERSWSSSGKKKGDCRREVGGARKTL